MIRLRRIFYPLVIVLVLVGCRSQDASQPVDEITVQLKWLHQAQFAGFYIAQEKGYYAEENINVTFVEGGPGIDIINTVASGGADFGVAAPEHILLQRSQGVPITAIATTYRRNPLVFVSLASSGIEQPIDFIGKRVAVGNNDGLIQFEAMMSNLGLDINEVNIMPYNLDLTLFFEGNVDVAPAFAAGSLIGILNEGHEINLIWPEDYGVLVYSDTIITTDQLIAENPDLVTRFLRATLRGHQDGVENVETAVNASMQYARDANIDIQTQMIQASLPLIHTGEDHIGWMKPEIWQGIYDMLLEQGVLDTSVDVQSAYTTQFLETIYGDDP